MKTHNSNDTRNETHDGTRPDATRRKVIAGAGAAFAALAVAGVGHASSKNVAIVLEVMEECPDLVLDLNTAFTKIFYEAQVELTREEKKELFAELSVLLEDAYPQVHVKV